jgi:hypothetical protein
LLPPYLNSKLEEYFSIVCSSSARFVSEPLDLPPCEATHLLVGSGFGHETKLKKRGKYTIEFYLFAELKYDLPSACVDRCMYYRKSYFEFVQGFDLTAGYIKVCRVEELYPDINILKHLNNEIQELSKFYYISKNQQILLTIVAPYEIQLAVALEKAIYSEVERAVAYGSSVTKGRSTTRNYCPNITGGSCNIGQ